MPRHSQTLGGGIRLVRIVVCCCLLGRSRSKAAIDYTCPLDVAAISFWGPARGPNFRFKVLESLRSAYYSTASSPLLAPFLSNTLRTPGKRPRGGPFAAAARILRYGGGGVLPKLARTGQISTRDSCRSLPAGWPLMHLWLAGSDIGWVDSGHYEARVTVTDRLVQPFR